MVLAACTAAVFVAGCAETIAVVVVETVGEVRLTDQVSDDPELPPVPEEPDTVVDLGDRPYLVALPAQCFSTSCTSALFAECETSGPDENGHVTIRMRMAVEVRDAGRGSTCTSDCATYVAECGRIDITHAEMTFSSPGGEPHMLTFPRTLGD